MPHLPDSEVITLGEGNVPILPAGDHLRHWMGQDLNLWLMLEGMTPTGSFKDFGGTVMISVASAAGVPGVICSSTGDTSAMAAAYAAAAGLSCVVLLPKGQVTEAQIAQALVHGARVILLPGTFDDCMQVVRDLVEHHGLYPANSLNPSRIEGHMATVFLLAQFFGWELPDWIAVPVGNGSNSSSIGKGMRLANDLHLVSKPARILGCQSEAANPLARSWQSVKGVGHTIVDTRQWQNAYTSIEVGETTATAARIGNPVSRDKVMREIAGAAKQGAMGTSAEVDLNKAVEVCARDGMFVCPQTGIALAGVRNAVKSGMIGPDESVAVVSTATGLKFTESTVAHLENKIVEADDCRTATVANMLGV